MEPEDGGRGNLTLNMSSSWYSETDHETCSLCGERQPGSPRRVYSRPWKGPGTPSSLGDFPSHREIIQLTKTLPNALKFELPRKAADMAPQHYLCVSEPLAGMANFSPKFLA